MFQILNYYGRFQTSRQQFGMLPSWARFLVFVAAIPGILLLVLSGLVFIVGLLALLLLAVPVYRALSALVGGRRPADMPVVMPSGVEAFIENEPAEPAARRHVDVTIIE